MKNILKIFFAGLLVLVLASCGNGSKDKKGDLTDKKAQLEKLKKDQKDLADKIAKLEDEIAKSDTSEAQKEKAKLVSLSTIGTDTFAHYIDLQGKISAENVAYVTPRGQGGLVKAVYVKQGDYVKKGQLLLKLDNALAERQIEGLQTQLAYAKDIYQRQQNLWNQGIGTEVQLLNAKNSVDNLEKQIASAKEQLSQSNVYAEMSGVADVVTIKVGETFTAAGASTIGIAIVNTSNLKVTAEVPENYLGRVREGNDIVITLPEINKTIKAKINVAGKLIDPNSRSFYIEAKIPAGKDFRPNQIALTRILDYASNNAITIPVNTLQNDEKGKYVLVAEKEKDKLVARKRQITTGELYGDKLEVKSGLQPGDQLITDGFQGLYDGQTITTGVE